MQRIVVHGVDVDVGALDEAVRAIRRGGVVAMPTDTLYGLAVDPFQPAAVERLFQLKGRQAGKALPLIAADIAQVRDRIGLLSPLAARLAADFWPGPLTLIMKAPASIAAAVLGDAGTIALRVPAHLVARALCQRCGVPVTATSANLSGQAASADPDDIARMLSNGVDVLIDAGATPGSPPSTIVDTTRDAPALVRAGAIPWKRIEESLMYG